MLKIITQHPLAALLAVVIHLVFLLIIGVSLTWDDGKPSVSTPKVDVVQAVAVDEVLLQVELKKLKANEQKKQARLDRRARKAKQARLREEKRLAELKKKRTTEKKLQKELKKKYLAEQQIENKRLAMLKLEKQLLEKQKKQEEERLNALAARRQKEEREALRRAEQLQREQALRDKIAVEERRMAEEKRNSTQRQSTIAKYRALIEAEVRRHWLVPAGAKVGMISELVVRLIPSGDVVHVQITKSSGDPVFDRSVENAIRKASPLPVPPAESGYFEDFRELKFPFKLKKKT